MAEHFHLPKLAYFTQGNMRICSATPEDLIAQPLEPIFQYRVCVRDDRLAVECYVDNKCYELTDKDQIRRNAFDVSAEGILAAEDWLEEEYRRYESTAVFDRD